MTPGPAADEPPVAAGAPRLWLAELSISQPVFIAMVVTAVIVVGGLLYSRMAVDLWPDVSFPFVAVQTVYPGASPEEVERSVTKPIEDAVASINGVDTLRSISSDGVSLVILQFRLERNVKDATDDVQGRLKLVRSTLPADAKEPIVQRLDPSAAPVLSVVVADRTGGRSPQELRSLMDDTLRSRLERADGVAAVTVAGGRIREVHVDLRLDRLQALGVAPQQITAAIRGENATVPAGHVNASGAEEAVRTSGEFRSVSEIGEVTVPLSGGARVKLKELARVFEGSADVRSLSRLDGRESVVATVQKRSGTNTVRVADAIKAELARIERDHADLDIAVVDDASMFVRDSVQDMQAALVSGALLAALVVLLFFRDLRNTLITVAGLPVILLGTFGVMSVLGMSVNMITLLGLSLSIGLLIDDAIVVRENIIRHNDAGEDPRTAARRGTAEIALAVLAVSSTIVAVFIPIAFSSGIIGRILRDFGITVAVAVLISLVEAFTLAPMLSAFFVRGADPSRGVARPSGPLVRLETGVNDAYRRLLGYALGHRGRVVAAGVVVFAASLAILPLLSRSFVNESDVGEFTVTLELPPGTPLVDTDRAARAAEEVLRARPEVLHLATTVGSADGAVDKASIGVTMRDRRHTAAVVAAVRPELARSAGPTGKVATDMASLESSLGNSFAAGAVRERPIQVAVQGPNFTDLETTSRQLVERFRAIPGMIDVDRSATPGKPGRDVVVDRAKAADLGVGTAQVGATVRTLVNGEAVTTYRAGEKSYDVVVRLQPADRASWADVLAVPLVTTNETQVPLSAVARLVPDRQPAQIEREGRQRQILVVAGVLGREEGAVIADAQAAVAALRPSLPAGVTVTFAGNVREMEEAFGGLAVALALAILFVYMILASQFRSLVHPFTIMLALPFSLSGALVALLATGKSLDILGFIGVILLMGLVVKNSILLVDFADRRRRAGASAAEAMLEAGPIRLRPILMTTLAMIFGMIPVAVGLGAGAETRQPMGITVIGGLVASTLLSLVVVPVMYTLLDDLVRLVTRRRAVPVPRGEGARIEPGARTTG